MKIRNSNIEIRNKPKELNPKCRVRNGFVWNFLIFDHLKLFRISDFEIRILCLGFFRDRKAVDFRAEIFLAGALEDARRDGDILVRRADRFE